MNRITPFRAFVVASTLVLAACGSGSDSGSDSVTTDASDSSTEASASTLTITDAWSRQPAEGQSVGVVYGTATNATDADIRIVSAASPVSDNVQIHETIVADDGAMSMSEVEEGFVVPAGGEFVFEPGGPHIMLLDIDAATFPADEVDMTLTLDSGDELAFSAPVKEIGADDDLDHGDMDDMDHGDS